MSAALLAEDDPPPFAVFNRAGPARILLVCDHASRRIPSRLGDMGLSETDRLRHIAWDIGAADVTQHLAERFDAPAIFCGYSRLVVDCNRHVDDPSLMPAVSDGTRIAANAALGEPERRARIESIYRPYHAAIGALLDELIERHGAPAVLSVHSCTPYMNGRHRPWHIGVCWERDRRLAGPALEALQRRRDIVVGDNQPYALTSEEDYTIPWHAMRRGLPHLLVEFRQDLIDTPPGARLYGDILLEALRETLADDALYCSTFD
jgi:predicted N-formylglutamate amidohydrolase